MLFRSNLETDCEEREILVVKKWTVDNDGNNEATIELKPKDVRTTRFLLKGELTREEYFSKRTKELGLNPNQLAKRLAEFLDEYVKLIES